MESAADGKGSMIFAGLGFLQVVRDALLCRRRDDRQWCAASVLPEWFATIGRSRDGARD
jgi:hypothetical protein